MLKDEERLVSWRELISDEMKNYDDNWKDVQLIYPTDLDLDREFDDGYGGIEGKPFTLWTNSRVYFPVGYDGSEWAGSVARHPTKEATDHVGGG